jgi:hypothetical protein
LKVRNETASDERGDGETADETGDGETNLRVQNC